MFNKVGENAADEKTTADLRSLYGVAIRQICA